MLAPGTYVLSARSRDTATTGYGLPDPAETAYMYDSGTSMATPLVAGCCALIREYLIGQRRMPTPSAALVKAVLINGASGIPGQFMPSETGVIANSVEGFGRVDMQATLGEGAGQVVLYQDEGRKLDTGEEAAVPIDVPDGTSELKATLVWTDPAGEGLQNDLDLIVRLGGQEAHGNVAVGDPAFDRLNNVEQVVWANPPAGQAQVIVRAFRVTQFPQDFALVVRLK